MTHKSGPWTVRPETHAYWLDDTSDSWYRSNGQKLWTGVEGSGPNSYAGSELSVVVTRTIAGGAEAEAGCSAFLCGNLADEISDRHVVHYGCAQLVVELWR